MTRAGTATARTLIACSGLLALALPPVASGASPALAPPRVDLAGGDGRVALRWSTVPRGAAISRIRVYRRAAVATWRRAPVASVHASAGVFIDRGLRNGRTYVYRFRAVGRSGRYSRMSKAVRVTPRRPARRPPAVSPGDPTPAMTARGEQVPGQGSEAAPPGAAGCSLVGAYHALNQPPACWKPYAATSPFNRPIPGSPKLAADSSAVVSRLRAWGQPQMLLAGHSGTPDDYFHPMYYGRASDPLFTVHCTTATRSCAIEGHQVRIPDAARPAAGGDGHLAVIDQVSGWEYDFWQVQSKPSGGGTLTVSHGGRTRIDGEGLDSNATAAWFGLAAGIIRAPEVAGGVIDHALFAAVKCTAGASVYPAQPGTTANACADFGLANAAAPPLGARLQLAMSDAEIAALAIPDWKKTILRALAHYGLIVGDTNGGHAAWGLVAESGSSSTSFGLPDPWVSLAQGAGLQPFGGMYAFDIASVVDWSRFRVLDPCVSKGSC